MSLAPGEVVLEHASRSFSVRSDRGLTLKELLFRRRASGPPPVHALDDVSLRVRAGETLGIVGRNGAGKSSTLRVLAGIVPVQSGRAECAGTVVSLLELGAGFGREFSGRENVYLNGALHGLSKAQIEERLPAILEFSELAHFVDVPVKTYSSGMLVRLGFSIAAHLNADVMLIDEVLAVGDEAFQRKCLRRIGEHIAQGTTVVLVSHAPGAIERVCQRVVVLDGGRVVFDGPTPEALLYYHQLLGADDQATATPPRRPSRRLLVEDIELQDAEGRRRQVFQTGEPLRISMRLTARTTPLRPKLVLEFREHSGHRVFTTDTRPELGEGSLDMAFEIPRLALLGGDYDLVASLHEADDPDPGIDRLVGFGVAHEPYASGVADLRGSWSVARSTAVVS